MLNLSLSHMPAQQILASRHSTSHKLWLPLGIPNFLSQKAFLRKTNTATAITVRHDTRINYHNLFWRLQQPATTKPKGFEICSNYKRKTRATGKVNPAEILIITASGQMAPLFASSLLLYSFLTPFTCPSYSQSCSPFFLHFRYAGTRKVNVVSTFGSYRTKN
jgi:hypothetical protein